MVQWETRSGMMILDGAGDEAESEEDIVEQGYAGETKVNIYRRREESRNPKWVRDLPRRKGCLYEDRSAGVDTCIGYCAVIGGFSHRLRGVARVGAAAATLAAKAMRESIAAGRSCLGTTKTSLPGQIDTFQISVI